MFYSFYLSAQGGDRQVYKLLNETHVEFIQFVRCWGPKIKTIKHTLFVKSHEL